MALNLHCDRHLICWSEKQCRYVCFYIAIQQKANNVCIETDKSEHAACQG
jgi:hypothetical protein